MTGKDQSDLTPTEQNWLRQMSQGPTPLLPNVVAERLKSLGYAEQKLGGTGMSAKGREAMFSRIGTARSRRL